MNRSETSRALEMLTIYQPNTPKPDNPELAVDTWAYELGEGNPMTKHVTIQEKPS